MATTTTTTTQEPNFHHQRRTVVETALDWWNRCNVQQQPEQVVPIEDHPPHDPSSAAWSFIRGNSGIAPIDAAWKRNTNALIRGSSPDTIAIDGQVGKTWMLISLAARFVVDTRRSKFVTAGIGRPDNENYQQQGVVDCRDHDHQLPFVVILDSTYDVTPSKVRQVVHSTLLRQTSLSANDYYDIEKELNLCLDRIHVASVTDDIMGWVPILELLRFELKHNHERCSNNFHPALVLWDGFLSEPATSESSKMEVVRQMTRLIQDCSVAFVHTSDGRAAAAAAGSGGSTSIRNMPSFPSGKYSLGSQHKTHHIHLKRYSGKDCLAEIPGMRVPFYFSLSQGGVIS